MQATRPASRNSHANGREMEHFLCWTWQDALGHDEKNGAISYSRAASLTAFSADKLK
jgi:hypothetical protein